MARRSGRNATGAVSQRAAIDGDALYVPLDGRTPARARPDNRRRRAGTSRSGIAPTEPLAYDDRVYLGVGQQALHLPRGADPDGSSGNGRSAPASSARRRRTTAACVLHRDGQLLRALSRDNGGQRWKQRLGLSPDRRPRADAAGRSPSPGSPRELPAGSTSTTGKATGKLTFPVQLATRPVVCRAR